MYFKQVHQYKYKKVLGNGSYANVYLVEDDKNQYAMKEIKIEFDEDEPTEQTKKMMEYFEQEISIYKTIKHPNLVGFIEEFRDQSVIYCVQEYCSNGDLSAFLKKRRLNEKEIKTLFISILSGMQYLYKKRIVHRDLKLDNILINYENNIKIADFGFAKYASSGQILTSYCGTPATMAPEVLNSEQYDHKCDIWSLGVILYYMIYRKYHWRGNIRSIQDLQRFLSKFKIEFDDSQFLLSDEGKDILTKMLVSDPSKRIDYEELFVHPWLEGKLENQDNVGQSQEIISQQNTVTIGQLIGNEIVKLRQKKKELNDMILQFIKDCRCEIVKQNLIEFQKEYQYQKFHVIIIAQNNIDQEEGIELYDYLERLQTILSNQYEILQYNYLNTVIIEKKLIKFIEENKLSNTFIFQIEEDRSINDLKEIRQFIVEKEVKEQNSENIKIESVVRDNIEFMFLQQLVDERIYIAERDQIYTSISTSINNILR